MPPKIHLRVVFGRFRRLLCGRTLRDAKWSDRPAQVTCKGCVMNMSISQRNERDVEQREQLEASLERVEAHQVNGKGAGYDPEDP